jgi:hypothetical protein
VKLPIKVAPYQNMLSHFCSIYFGHVRTETMLFPDSLWAAMWYTVSGFSTAFGVTDSDRAYR